MIKSKFTNSDDKQTYVCLSIQCNEARQNSFISLNVKNTKEMIVSSHMYNGCDWLLSQYHKKLNNNKCYLHNQKYKKKWRPM